MGVIGVYAIANKVSKKIYVGASNDIEARFSAHKSQLRNGKHHYKTLQEDWAKFGESEFEFKILELSDSQNYVPLERKYIIGFASLNKDCLYNQFNLTKKPKPQSKKQFRRTGRFSTKAEKR